MSTNLTAHDLKILATAFQCFESTPKVDYGKLQTAMGWATKATAQSIWSNVKKKVMACKDAGADDDTPLQFNGRGRGRKRNAEEAALDDDDDNETAPGLCLPRRDGQEGQSQSQSEEKVSGGIDEDLLATVVPPRPIQRRRKAKEKGAAGGEKVGAGEGTAGGEEGAGGEGTAETEGGKEVVEGEKGVKKEPEEEEDDEGDFLAELEAYARRAESRG